MSATVFALDTHRFIMKGKNALDSFKDNLFNIVKEERKGKFDEYSFIAMLYNGVDMFSKIAAPLIIASVYPDISTRDDITIFEFKINLYMFLKEVENEDDNKNTFFQIQTSPIKEKHTPIINLNKQNPKFVEAVKMTQEAYRDFSFSPNCLMKPFINAIMENQESVVDAYYEENTGQLHIEVITLVEKIKLMIDFSVLQKEKILFNEIKLRAEN